MKTSFQFEDIFQEEDMQAIEQHESELRKLGAAARACINSEKFVAYKERMEKVLAQMPDVLISFTNDYFNEMNGDMAFYGAKMARYITKIQNLRMMLKAVEIDFNKSIGQGEKDEKDSRS